MKEQKITNEQQDVRIHVRQHYGQIASSVKVEERAACCGSSDDRSQSSCCSPGEVASIDQVSRLYEIPDVADLPEDVTNLSLGCGDPVTLALLSPGQTVLDLGSGGGIDCFLAARRVGESGRVIGVDMTSEMIDKARTNKEKLGAENVEFRLGEIENLPVADGIVDVVISNCVINLSPDKRQVFREAYRVLKPGGYLAVSDIVTNGPLPDAIMQSLSAWASCVAGALTVEDYLAAIEEAGFVEVELTPVYLDDAQIDAAAEQLDLGEAIAGSDKELSKAVFSAKVTAHKPSQSA
jgi:SAM-dependent methyltransferase